MSEALEAARQLVPKAVELFGDCDVRLFGSYAKGTQRPGSDIDVAVVIREIPQGETPSTMFDKSVELDMAAWEIDHRIETVVRTLNDPSGFTKTVLETGIPLNP